MSRTVIASIGCLSAGLTLTGCASAPVQTAANYASEGAHATYGVASTGAHAVYSTGGQVYMGVGQAAKKPFHDLNMMQDPIPQVLLRNESKPYDLEGVNSCERILNQVAELDLALGPDLDSPKDHGRNRISRGADSAAVAALDAATDAAEHFLPMRSVIKRVSGATRYENHVKHAVLAGTVRRAFLKAIGMSHDCGWPASPLVFNATDVAAASSAWTPPGDRASLQMVAIATPAPLAVPPVPVYPANIVLASARSAPANGRSSMTRSRIKAAHTAELQTIAQQTPVAQSPTSQSPTSQRVASTPSAAPVFMQHAVKASASETSEPTMLQPPASGYYAASSYIAPSPAAATYAASPAPPWATPQH